MERPHTEHTSREAAYDKARRSLRAWPIEGDNQCQLLESFKNFALEALQIPREVYNDTKISEIIRVRNSPTGRVHQEIRVTFELMRYRDFFSSAARNLADYKDEEGRLEARVRMDVPPFLLSMFKQLTDMT